MADQSTPIRVMIVEDQHIVRSSLRLLLVDLDGVLARAGFPRDVALRALAMEAQEAEEAIRVSRT